MQLKKPSQQLWEMALTREECNVGFFTSAFPKELDSGQKAIEQLNVANWREQKEEPPVVFLKLSPAFPA